MPQIPNATRWNSQLDFLNTFVKNYPLYLQKQKKGSEIPEIFSRILKKYSEYAETTHSYWKYI